ncbi:MAG: thrombospondin type 3 repeat-containing protein [Deltaproteobacteria bacterium]|nr:thrombospondin type 3 repeat-containing protein [Deltaproteobacteria bacterium]
MKRTLIAATVALLLWGAPALAGPQTDSDGDGVYDGQDNCSDVSNLNQDDTDGDDCGNLCDADYDDDGVVNFLDFSAFSNAFGSNDLEMDHTPPVAGNINFIDFSFFSNAFGSTPGPSGTTTGTTACP